MGAVGVRKRRVRRGRSKGERCADLLLLLYLIWDARERGCMILGETKLQKLVFLAEREMLGKRYKGFNYNFVRLDFGPYSAELKRDLTLLLEVGLVEDHPREGLVLTQRGERVLREVMPLLRRHAEILEVIEGVNERFAGMDLGDLLEHVYGLPRPLKGAKVTIREVKQRTPLLKRIEAERAAKAFELTSEDLRVLDVVLLDPEVEEWRAVRVRGYRVLLFRIRGESGYSAVVPALPGCCSQGETEEEALRNVEEAIELYLEGE